MVGRRGFNSENLNRRRASTQIWRVQKDRGGQNRSQRGQKLERLAGLPERAVVEVGGSRADHISTPYK